jgi:hypothetical protein
MPGVVQPAAVLGDEEEVRQASNVATGVKAGGSIAREPLPPRDFLAPRLPPGGSSGSLRALQDPRTRRVQAALASSRSVAGSASSVGAAAAAEPLSGRGLAQPSGGPSNDDDVFEGLLDEVGAGGPAAGASPRPEATALEMLLPGAGNAPHADASATHHHGASPQRAIGSGSGKRKKKKKKQRERDREDAAAALARHGVRVAQEARAASVEAGQDGESVGRRRPPPPQARSSPGAGGGGEGHPVGQWLGQTQSGGATGSGGWAEGALHVAAAKGDAYKLSLLIGDRLVAGQSPSQAMDGVDGNEWTALHYACQHGGVKSVRVLLDAGCAVDVADGTGWTPLMEAAWNGHAEALLLLLQRLVPDSYRAAFGASSRNGPRTGSRSSASSGRDSAGAAGAAASEEATAASQQLDVKDKDGWTALHAAAYAADMESVSALLRCGATPGVQDSAAQTPAVVAAAQGAPQIGARVFLPPHQSVQRAAISTEVCLRSVFLLRPRR